MKTLTKQKSAAGHSHNSSLGDLQQQRLADARARVQRVGGVQTLEHLVATFGNWPVAEASGKVVPTKG
ncbi:MAG: hypothetical protein AB3X41_04170 [Leptothrix ochracea]|uniref:hypothetical protein n=1 Tax=Leptothrix ochracea TaxID=735331 RepID=UPI0034E2CF77